MILRFKYFFIPYLFEALYLEGLAKNSSYVDGIANTIYMLTDSITLLEASKHAKFSLFNTNTIEAIVSDTFEDLLFATNNTSRNIKKLVRSVAMETMQIGTIRNQGRRNMTAG